jgi:hypothetical protein
MMNNYLVVLQSAGERRINLDSLFQFIFSTNKISSFI